MEFPFSNQCILLTVFFVGHCIFNQVREALKKITILLLTFVNNGEVGWVGGGSGACFVNKKNSPNALKQPKKCIYKMLFSFLCRGGVSDSHVQAQILPVGARKGDDHVGRTLFF